MYKHIVFDLGGVMVDWNPKDYLMERFYRSSIEDTLYNIIFGSEAWQQLDAGLITRFEANRQMLAQAEQNGCTFEAQEVLDNWTRILRPRPRMIELAHRLKTHGYSIYYLSNIASDTLDSLMSGALKDVFDGGVASCDVHINKPDPRIYQALLEKYDLKANECVFVDDRLENVQGAFAQGITGVVMRGSNVGTLVRNLASCNIALR
jgi:putative hydrolase of the HAD superfamily